MSYKRSHRDFRRPARSRVTNAAGTDGSVYRHEYQPGAAIRKAYAATLEVLNHPPSKVRSFADMTPEEQEAMRNLYERKGRMP